MKTRNWLNNWRNYPDRFYQRSLPAPLESPQIIHSNQHTASLLGLSLSEVNHPASLACFSGQSLFPQLTPIATVYGGHQFGIYTSTLGDGRAVLLGSIQNDSGEAYEVQLKGAGITPYSRTMNGRLSLADAIREYVASAALNALGIPCTSSLCLIGSKTLISDGINPATDTAALLVRVASSHYRFGHFEYYFHRDDMEGLTTLFNGVVEHCFPELSDFSAEQRPLLFVETVFQKTARLIAEWQSIGFTHGVMNTDNMAISGDTLDLGPFGFISHYDPHYSPNPSDEFNRYQFDQQADIGRWNCLALAQALTPLLKKPVVPSALLRLYRQRFQQQYLELMRAKLGLQQDDPGDSDLINSLLTMLKATRCDYTDFFRDLALIAPDIVSNQHLFASAQQRELLDTWLSRYRARLSIEKRASRERKRLMNNINPLFTLQNHMLNPVIDDAQQGKYDALKTLMQRVQNPYQSFEHSGLNRHPHQQTTATML